MPWLMFRPMTEKGVGALRGADVRMALRRSIKQGLPDIWPTAAGDVEANFDHPPFDADPEGPDIIVWLITTNQGRLELLEDALDGIFDLCRRADLLKPNESLFLPPEVIDITGEAPDEGGGTHRLWMRYNKDGRVWKE